MSEKDDVVTAYDARWEYFECIGNGYLEIRVPVYSASPDDDVVIETWRRVYINNKPAWERIGTEKS